MTCSLWYGAGQLRLKDTNPIYCRFHAITAATKLFYPYFLKVLIYKGHKPMLSGFILKRSKEIGNVTNLATWINIYKTAKIVYGLGKGS